MPGGNSVFVGDSGGKLFLGADSADSSLRVAHKMALRSYISLPLWVLILLSSGCSFISSGGDQAVSVSTLVKKSATDLQGHVRFSAFVTAVDRNSKTIYLQDQTGAVRVRVATTENLPTPGSYVETSGFLANGWPSQTVVNPTFKFLSKPEDLSYPQAIAASVADLQSGKHQYRLCRIQGVLRGVRSDDVDLPVAELVSGQHRIDLPILDTNFLKMRDLTNAQVTAEGVVDTGFDMTGQPIEITMLPTDLDHIQVDVPPVALKDVPQMTIDQVLGLAPEKLPEHEIRLRGTITQEGSTGTQFFLSDGKHQIPIRTILENTLPVGAVVEAVGFVSRINGVLSLDDASLTQQEETESYPSILRTVIAVKHLPFATAALGIPVDFSGVVTYFDPRGKTLFVQDDTGGIYIQLPHNLSAQLHSGQLVRVQGVTDPDDFATSIKKSSITVIGNGQLPKGIVPDYDLIFSGAEDSNWIQLSGVIESIDNVSPTSMVNIRAGKTTFRAFMANNGRFPESLLDSRVSVEGVCGSKYNSMRQFLGVDMYVPDLSFIHVREPGVPVSQLPVLSIRKLLEYSPQSAIGHRVRVRGIVTSSSPQGPTTLQDSSGSVKVLDHNSSRLVPGDMAEAIGFLQVGELSPVLEHAAISSALGRGAVTPRVVIAEQILQRKMTATLVQLDAQLLDQAKTNSGEVLSFQSGGINFQAYLNGAFGLPGFRRGAILRLTGVTTLDPVKQNEVPSTFGLKLRSAADIQVIKDAPWLTFEKTLQLGGILTLIFGAAALWITMLRRQVRRQTTIIEEKLAREEALREEAEQFSRSKSEFLANISHEIRTPMNGVLGMTELALNAELDPDVREYLTMAHASGEQLLELLNDVLDMSKIEAGHITLEKTEFSPCEIATEVARTVAKRAHDKGLELMIDVDSSVPQTAVGDPHRLMQVLLNLAGNAVKFTEKGEIVITALAEEVDSETWRMRFQVKDTGIGVPADKTEQIFSAFTQADGSTTRKYGGTGLGLSICKQLVGLMGGEIGVDSAVGVGSEFWFTVKLQKAPTQFSDAPPLDLSGLQNVRVLIVDDNATSRHLLGKTVARWGLQPTSVADTSSALSAARTAVSEAQPFSLFLLDCQMPGEDSFFLARALHEFGLVKNDSAVIMLSPLDSAYVAQCRGVGGVRHLVKPITQKQLLEALLEGFTAAQPEQKQRSTERYAGAEIVPVLDILLAEDNRVNQLVARRFLERQGHRITIVDNGVAAVQAVQNGKFDVVLMDLQMPEMDGYEATRRIRELPSEAARHLPIIALTAHAMESDKTKCLEAGMTDFLTKPLQADQLSEKLKLLTATHA
jgi:signal transduction histidine kinase/CheY-like chemotaxis protein